MESQGCCLNTLRLIAAGHRQLARQTRQTRIGSAEPREEKKTTLTSMTTQLKISIYPPHSLYQKPCIFHLILNFFFFFFFWREILRPKSEAKTCGPLLLQSLKFAEIMTVLTVASYLLFFIIISAAFLYNQAAKNIPSRRNAAQAPRSKFGIVKVKKENLGLRSRAGGVE